MNWPNPVKLLTTCCFLGLSALPVVHSSAADTSHDIQLALLRRALAEDEIFQLISQSRAPSDQEEQDARQAILTSEQALDLLEWLVAYSRSSSNSGPDDVEKFYERLNQMSSSQLKLVLLRVDRERERIRQMSASTRRSRNEALAYSRQFSAQRNRPTSPIAQGGRGGTLSSPYGDHYGTSARSARRIHRRDYRVPPPLITSREVARWGIFRTIFPRW